MTSLVVGASGATGRLLVEQLLNDGNSVKVVVRKGNKVFEQNRKNLTIIHASILKLEDEEILQLVNGCNAIFSCLGHNMSFKGIWGPPRRLVTDATRRLCQAVKRAGLKEPVKFILMNTVGNSNRDIHERISLGQACVIWLLRLLVPPHGDNEKAADFLRTEIGQNNSLVEWAAVRPDGLLNENEVTKYELYPSPIRSAIFDSGTTSRINVADFMSRLATDSVLWEKWKGQMPVIYNIS